MSRIGGAIGETAADRRIPFDQGHLDVVGEATQEMAREQHAACASAHDDDVPAAACIWFRALPVRLQRGDLNKHMTVHLSNAVAVGPDNTR